MTLSPKHETHIFLDRNGTARVKRAGVKVRLIIESLEAYACPPEELVRHFPYLKVTEVYAAMAYYHDHRAELDEEIRSLREFARHMRETTPDAPITKRLRDAGLLPPRPAPEIANPT